MSELKGWLDCLDWIKEQLFQHNREVAMGEFIPAALATIEAKKKMVKSHESTGKVQE